MQIALLNVREITIERECVDQFASI